MPMVVVIEESIPLLATWEDGEVWLSDPPTHVKLLRVARESSVEICSPPFDWRYPFQRPLAFLQMMKEVLGEGKGEIRLYDVTWEEMEVPFEP